MNELDIGNGRKVGLTEWGEPSGPPVLYFSGTPSSRGARPVQAASARMITIERPGYGISSPTRDRSPLALARDLRVVLDRLGIERASIVSNSGGGIFALACGVAIPDRVHALAVVGSLGPLDDRAVRASLGLRRRAILALAGRLPWLVRGVVARQDPHREPTRFYRQMVDDLDPCDRRILERPDVWERQLAVTREAFAQGADAFVTELLTHARPWDFWPEDVKVPVHLWYGERDHTTPPGIGRALARRIPRAELHVLPGEGHFLMWTDLERILAP
ncbi:MAG: alpha/beta fold hydrolase, partial [Polyangiales bacterium]